MATHCAFGDYLSEAIRDRIVCICGLCNKGIQKRLLAENDLNLAKTLEIAQSMEAADRNAQKLKGNKLNLRVSEISLGTKKNCYRCGSEQHGPRECPYREVECRSCKRRAIWLECVRVGPGLVTKIQLRSSTFRAKEPSSKIFWLRACAHALIAIKTLNDRDPPLLYIIYRYVLQVCFIIVA